MNFVLRNISRSQYGNVLRVSSCLTNNMTNDHGQKNYPVSLIKIYPTCDYCTNLVKPQESDGILTKVLKKVGFKLTAKSRIKITSYILYESVADKINYLEFFQEFNLPNTFNSWFTVTELHVWMLLLRSMVEGSDLGEDGRELRNYIVEAMWADVNTRAKKLGASNLSGTRAQINILSEQFQASLIAYDEGIMSDDKTLGGALWRRFFGKDITEHTYIEKLVLYVRKQVHMLDSINRQNFLVKPKILWIPLKDIKV